MTYRAAAGVLGLVLALAVPSESFAIGNSGPIPWVHISARSAPSSGSENGSGRLCRGQDWACFQQYLRRPYVNFMRSYTGVSGPFNTGAQAQDAFCGVNGTAANFRSCIAEYADCVDRHNFDYVLSDFDYLCGEEGRRALSAMDGHSCSSFEESGESAANCPEEPREDEAFCDYKARRTQCFFELDIQRCSLEVATLVLGATVADSSIQCPEMAATK